MKNMKKSFVTGLAVLLFLGAIVAPANAGISKWWNKGKIEGTWTTDGKVMWTFNSGLLSMDAKLVNSYVFDGEILTIKALDCNSGFRVEVEFSGDKMFWRFIDAEKKGKPTWVFDKVKTK